MSDDENNVIKLRGGMRKGVRQGPKDPDASGTTVPGETPKHLDKAIQARADQIEERQLEPVLTGRMEKFCQLVMELRYTDPECVKLAGYKTKKPSVQAAKLRQHPGVAKRLEELRADAAERNRVTHDEVVAGLREAAMMAKHMDKPSDMISAYRELGRMINAFGENKYVHVHQDYGTAFQGQSEDRLAAIAEAARRKEKL